MKELTVKDLMIGNWVKIPHLNKIGKVYRIDMANGEGNGFAAVIDGDYYEGNLEPIPLTTEIFEENGFNLLKDAYGMSDPFLSYSNRSVLIDVTIIRTNNVKVIDWFNIKISTKNDIKQISFYGVKYVHQLQQALRLCGIKKEIEL